MQIDRQKLKATILYVISSCKPEDLGAVKLHKVLYFTDMINYINDGTPFVGATYTKRPHGPTCDQLLTTLREMKYEGSINIDKVEYFGYVKYHYTSKETVDPHRFDKEEIHLLNDAIDFVCRNNTAKTISEFSHTRAWDMVEFGEPIEYKTAFHILPAQVSPEALEWAGAEADRLEAEGSLDDTMGDVPFASIRSRFLETRSGPGSVLGTAR